MLTLDINTLLYTELIPCQSHRPILNFFTPLPIHFQLNLNTKTERACELTDYILDITNLIEKDMNVQSVINLIHYIIFHESYIFLKYSTKLSKDQLVRLLYRM